MASRTALSLVVLATIARSAVMAATYPIAYWPPANNLWRDCGKSAPNKVAPLVLKDFPTGNVCQEVTWTGGTFWAKLQYGAVDNGHDLEFATYTAKGCTSSEVKHVGGLDDTGSCLSPNPQEKVAGTTYEVGFYEDATSCTKCTDDCRCTSDTCSSSDFTWSDFSLNQCYHQAVNNKYYKLTATGEPLDFSLEQYSDSQCATRTNQWGSVKQKACQKGSGSLKSWQVTATKDQTCTSDCSGVKFNSTGSSGGKEPISSVSCSSNKCKASPTMAPTAAPTFTKYRSVTVKPAFEKWGLCSDFDGWKDSDDKECEPWFNGRYKESCPDDLNAPKSGINISEWANSAGVDASQACCRCGGGEGKNESGVPGKGEQCYDGTDYSVADEDACAAKAVEEIALFYSYTANSTVSKGCRLSTACATTTKNLASNWKIMKYKYYDEVSSFTYQNQPGGYKYCKDTTKAKNYTSDQMSLEKCANQCKDCEFITYYEGSACGNDMSGAKRKECHVFPKGGCELASDGKDNWVQVGSNDSRCDSEVTQPSVTNVADKAACQKQAESNSAQASWFSLSENTTVNNSARGFSHPYWCFTSKTCNDPKNSSVDLPSFGFSDYLGSLKPSWKRFSNANASALKSGSFDCRDLCINGNTAYSTMTEAVQKCSDLQSCAIITKQAADDKFYLRKASDIPSSAGQHAVYSCSGTAYTYKLNPGEDATAPITGSSTSSEITTIQQTISFSGISASQFKDKIQTVANCAYGTELKITEAKCSYVADCSVKSTASRRDTSVEFTASVTAAKKSSAESAAAALTKSSFQTAMNQAKESLGSSYSAVNIPNVSAVESPKTPSGSTSGATSLDLNVLAMVVILSASVYSE